mgnify:CR=1 FL=1
MKEVLISFLVFVFCISITIYSQVNSPKMVNAAQTDLSLKQTTISTNNQSSKNNNIFELDPTDPNPTLFAMANSDELKISQQGQSEEITTESGLVILDLVVGEGEEAIPGKTVTVNYTGKLENGEQFDTSIGRAPFSFPLGAGRVIKGWDEGVAGMKVGGQRKLTIPPELAYGTRGAGNVIPPNATLIFDVELLKVV